MGASEKLDIIINAKDNASGGIKNIAGALGGLGKLAIGAAAAGIGAAVTGIGALAGGVVALAKEAASLGPISDAFAGLNESVGRSADDMLKALQAGSKGLITNTDLMTSFNKAAQLVSVDFAQRLPDAMGMLGKVAAATGQDMGFLLDSLVTGVGRLSPMILDNLGIQVDLTAAQEEYAASIGKTAGELTKQEQQTALMNQVMTKLAKNTASMPDISDPFKQLSVTMTNLKNDVAMAIGPVVLPLIQDLANSISRFVQSDEFQAWIKSAVGWLRDSFVPALRQIWEWLSTNLPPAIQAISAFVTSTLIPALQRFGGFIQSDIAPAVQSFIEFFTVTIPNGIQQFVAFLEATGIADLIRGIFDNIMLGLSLFKAMWEGDWRRVGEIMRQMVDNAIGTAISLFKKFWGNVLAIDWRDLGASIIRGIGEGLKSLMQWLIKTGFDIMKALYDIFAGFFDIGSPSKKMVKMGLQLTQGLAIGLERGMAALTNGLPRSLGSFSLAMAGASAPAYHARQGGGSSNSVTVVYSPYLSTGSRAEFEQQFLPVLNGALKRLNRGTIRR
ncbi:MAG: hypothetical protein KKD77_21045, partial [Gammaproteobacteria bacterium]|nr:hypothetical protein [Gammaproteobacteria bacterium]